jgi:hypothetical protein
MQVIGAGVCALGAVILLGREEWIVDRNLLLIRSRVLQWKSQREFINAGWQLARVQRIVDARVRWHWELRLVNHSENCLRVLRTDADDDVPRLLGTLLSKRTGWALQDLEPTTTTSSESPI